MSALEPIHAIHPVLHEVRAIAKAMCYLGIPAGDDLRLLMDEIETLAKEASAALCAEANAQYQESLEQTRRMTLAVLDSCIGTPNANA